MASFPFPSRNRKTQPCSLLLPARSQKLLPEATCLEDGEGEGEGEGGPTGPTARPPSPSLTGGAARHQLPPAMGRSGLPSLTGGAAAPAGDGRNPDDRVVMAAVLRGARAGCGGHGRGQGRRRAPAEEQQPVPQVQDRVTPLHHQWSLWCDGNQNTIKLVDNEELKAYRILEQSACIDRLELDSFAIPDELLEQQPHIVRMLYDLVDYYNNMMRIRRKYLVKKLDGCWSKEMEQMVKTLDKYLERVDEKLDAIADAEGNCPPRPKVFDALPKLHK